MFKKLISTEQRFLKYVTPEPNTGCWLWTGYRDRDGYGSFRLTTGPSMGAHRAAFSIFKGPPTQGLVVDHVCRQRSCVNPEHLREVTARVNSVENSISPPSANAIKKLCNKGHELTGGGVRIKTKPDGSFRKRECLICRRERGRKNFNKYYYKKKAERVAAMSSLMEAA